MQDAEVSHVLQGLHGYKIVDVDNNKIDKNIFVNRFIGSPFLPS
jgi:hypothetical protein